MIRDYGDKVKKIMLRYLLLLSGIFLMALSGAMVVKAMVGSGPIVILFQGIAVALNISLGTSILIVSVTFVIVLGLLNYRKIGIGTLFATFLIGPINNVLMNMIATPNHIALAYAMLIGGVLVNAIGATFYLYADIGLSPFEGVVLAVHEKYHLRIRYIKITMDAVFILSGFLLGGVLGFGTIIALFLTGFAIDFFYTFLIKRFGKLSQPTEA